MKPLKILLLNIPNEHELIGNDPIIIKEQQGVFPPLGLMYIASYLKKYTIHDIEFIDCQAKKIDYPLLKMILEANQYDAICFTAMTFTLIDTKLTIDLIKEVSPCSKIIVGGPHPTIYPKETLDLGADKVIIGEGERSIIELLNTEHTSAIGEKIQNLDLLPFPYRQDIDKYYCVLSPNKLTTMFTSRGCPFNCIYCDRPAMGKEFRTRSPENVVTELEECVKLGIKEFFIYDDTFTVDKERVYDICREIVKADLDIVLDIRTRVNCVDRDLLRALRYAGLKRIHFGAESGVQRVLNALNKGITLEQVQNAFKWCKELKIDTLAYFMIGNPTERKEDIDETYNFCRELSPDFTHFTILTPFPATKLYSTWLTNHNQDVWQDYASNPTKDFIPPVWDEFYTREELQAILRKIYKRYYLRPKFIFDRAREVKSLTQLKRYIKAGWSLLKGG